VHGARQSDEGGWVVDGMEMGNGNSSSSAGMYLDPFAFQEANYQGGNAPAESSRGGVVYSMVTRTGTNAFQGAFMMTGMNHHLQADNLTPQLFSDLMAAVPARALAANPNLVPSAEVVSMLNSGMTFSGPILRDKLWFATTADYGWLNAYQLGSYNPDGTRALDDNTRHSVSIKTSWQMASGHQLHFYNLWLQKDQLHRINPSETNTFWEPTAANYQYPNRKRLHQLRWTGALSSKLLAEVGASLMTGPMINMPRPELEHGDLPRFDRVTLVNHVARGSYNTHPTSRTILRPSLSYVTGSHDFKFGYEFNRGYTEFNFFSLSHYPSGLRAITSAGVPDSVNTYNTPTEYTQFEVNHGVYVQDRWTPIRKLTLNLGLRLQRTTGGQPAACQVETIFVAARCFPEIKNVPNFLDLTPRISAIYDLFGNGRTALKFAANRYLPGLEAGFVNRINPIRLTSDTRTWTDRNGDLFPQLDELGPSSGFNFGTTNRYSEDIKRPYSNEFSVEVEHQLPGSSVISVGYYHRQIRRVIGARNLAVPRESYTPITVTERNSGQQVTVYDQAAALRGRFDTLWDNAPEMNATYNGVDISFNKRLTNRWMMMGGMSFGKDEGDIYSDSSDLNDPNFTFRRGVRDRDVPVMLKTSFLYEFPYGIRLSGTAQHFSGFPEPQTVSVGRDTVALTRVTQSVQISPAGTTRLPDVNLADVSVRKTFRFAGRRTFEPIMDISNLGNVSTVQVRTTQLGPSYGRAGSILNGRTVKFGFNVNF
jgi:hypothetical protein